MKQNLKNNLEELNPCLKEQELSFKCFDRHNYDKEKCFFEIENYKACKKFWVSKEAEGLWSMALWETNKVFSIIISNQSTIFQNNKGEVRVARRRQGIKPDLPPVAEREKIRQEFVESKKKST